MANLIDPKTKKSCKDYIIKECEDDAGDYASADKFFDADANDSNCRANTNGSNCC